MKLQNVLYVAGANMKCHSSPYVILALALLIGGSVCGDETVETAAVLLDVFPESVVQIPAERQGTTRLSSTYTPSGSLWGKCLDEKTVFDFEMKHLQDEHSSFGLRIGKGGQLYSLRGAFGESVPPQSIGNPWNDEVWQFVCVGNYNFFDVSQLSEEARKRVAPYAVTHFIHNSGAYMDATVDSGVITISCDVLLDRETPGILDLIMRDPARRTFGTLRVSKAGVGINGVRVGVAKPGVWHHIEVSFELDAAKKQQFEVSVRTATGPAHTAHAPFAVPGIGAFSWIGLSGGGTEPGVFNIDNLTVRRDFDGKTEWPIKEDYESYAPLNLHGPADSVVVSDRVAVSGEHSLEIHDGPDVEHDWQPMARRDVHTTEVNNLYCPSLAVDVPADGRTYRTVNWGIVPQLKTIHRSPILYYVQTRDLGDGVIEMTYVVHNFSVRDDIAYQWLNAPWGGTRLTSLPFHYLSSPEGELQDREWLRKVVRGESIDIRETGGWNLSCSTEEDDSPSLALVFGRDKHLEAETARKARGETYCQLDGSVYRHMETGWPDDWQTIPENTFRNYEVAVVIPQLRLLPGTTIWYRSFLVVNRKDRTIELAKSLVDKVDYGYRTFEPDSTPMVPVNVRGGKVVDGKSSRPTEEHRENVGRETFPAFRLFAQPVPGSMPLFLIENTRTGQDVVSTDPYIFVPQEDVGFGLPPEHREADFYNNAVGYCMEPGKNNTDWKRLLGYGYKDRPETGDWVQLSSLLPPDQFPESSTYHLDLWVNMEFSQR